VRRDPRGHRPSTPRRDAGDDQTIDVRFGQQLHTRVLAGADDARELNPGQVAAYVAKYSCKASHEQITTRDTNPDRGVPEQLVEMAYAALHLTERLGLRDFGQWVHMLGFRGHFVTKSRGYSTNLGTLRAARATYRAHQDEPPEDGKFDGDESTVVLLLAAGVEASLRAAREALLDLRSGPP
jgi:hypothetical protein